MATTINLDNSTRVDITCRRGDTFTLELDEDGCMFFRKNAMVQLNLAF